MTDLDAMYFAPTHALEVLTADLTHDVSEGEGATHQVLCHVLDLVLKKVFEIGSIEIAPLAVQVVIRHLLVRFHLVSGAKHRGA